MKNARALVTTISAHLTLIVKSIWFWAPWVLISAVIGSMFYILTATAWQIWFETPFRSLFIYIFWSLGVGLFLWNQMQSLWNKSELHFKPIHFIFLILAGAVIGYRSTMYYDAGDDYVFHMIAGFYLDNIWVSKNFMPMDMATYLYPLLQVPYAFLTELIGIRFTLLLMSFLNITWLWHLHARFSAYFFEKEPDKRWILDLFFVYLFFFPDLMLSQHTFMSDFYSVLFALEVLYVFLGKGSLSLLGTLMAAALFAKQSSGLFFLPLFAYFFLARVKSIQKRDWIWLSALSLAIASFHLATYWFTGNPLSFLMNSVFQSPLYPLENFRDFRWGPETLREKLIWPLIGPFTTRYIEFPIGDKMKAFFSFFVSVPFVSSLVLIVWKRKFLAMVSLVSFFFWSWSSGYGRYVIGMCAVIMLLNLWEVRDQVPRVKTTLRTFCLAAFFCLGCFASFRQDYAWRGFYFEKMMPPRVSTYHSGLFWKGFAWFGYDRPQDIAQSLPTDHFSGYDTVAVYSRGISTYYAFLANRYFDKPVISAVSPEAQSDIATAQNVSTKHISNIDAAEASDRILLITEPWSVPDIQKTQIFLNRTCLLLDRPSSASAFQKPEYFDRVVEYECQ